MNDVLIVGAGIGGLTLALELHARGIACRVYESAPEIKAVGVGINLLPHAMGVLERAGAGAGDREGRGGDGRGGVLQPLRPAHLQGAARQAARATARPQFSIHRGDLQAILLEAVKARLGEDRLHLGWHCTGFSSRTSQA